LGYLTNSILPFYTNFALITITFWPRKLDFNVYAESVQQSLEKKFGKAGGSIPITPSDLFEKRMGVSIDFVA